MALIVATAALALLVAACGASQPSSTGVATMPNASAGPLARSSALPTSAASGEIAQALAYAQCIRSHGVSRWPDPDGSGVFDKSQVVAAVGRTLGSPQYQAYLQATSACQALAPSSMREPTPAQLQQQWADDRNFAQCMRDAGVSNAPDPVGDDEGRPYFNLSGTGIDPKSPQILAKAQACQLQLHLSTFPPATGGGGS
jgi:hypothetical protein